MTNGGLKLTKEAKMTTVKKISIDIRISMLQTCYNTAGSNYQTKSVKPETLSDYANKLYLMMMKQIAVTERDRLLAPKTRTTKKVTKTKADAIKKRIAKRNKKC